MTGIFSARAGRAALAAGVALGALVALPAFAQTNHAIIVGVSKYPNLPEDLWLVGPTNDAKMVREYLLSGAPLKFEPSEIAVLADGVDGAVSPTGDNIRTAFNQLAEKVQPGDFVFLSFSGHGSQMPARVEGSEQDGLDELFLPSDIGSWDQASGVIPNAMVDDDMGEMINTLVEKGANVWAIFDSCHSGTVTRAGPTAGDPLDAEKSRRLSPLALGIPEDVLDAVEPVRTRGGDVAPESATIETNGEAEGQFVYFYAAQTNQTTPEMRLPKDDPDRVSHGLFTYTILEALAQNPGVTYRQLGEEVLRRYSAGYRVQPTPLFEGSLDSQVFGAGGDASRVQQWPARQDGAKRVFGGGRLSGVSVGDELLLLPSPAAKDDEAIATVKVTATTDLTSEFQITKGGFVVMEPGQYVRKPEAEMRFGISVAMPDPSSLEDGDRDTVEAVLAEILTGDAPGLRLDLVDPGARADIRLDVADGALWLVPDGSQRNDTGANKTLSIGFRDREPAETSRLLGDSLARIARVANLTRLGGVFAEQPGGLDVRFSIQSKETRDRNLIAPPSVPRLEPGDEMYLEATNHSNRPLDLNILYVGATYSIDFMYNGRINPGETLRDGLLEIVEGEYGRERLITIVTPAEPQSAVADFGWLAQPALERTREVGGGGESFSDVLAEAGFGEKTRAAKRMSSGGGGDGSSIGQVELDIVPPGNGGQ